MHWRLFFLYSGRYYVSECLVPPPPVVFGGGALVGLASWRASVDSSKSRHAQQRTRTASHTAAELSEPPLRPLRPLLPRCARSSNHSWAGVFKPPAQNPRAGASGNMSASKAMEFMKLSEYQTRVLETSFNRDGKHPDGATLMLIAAECGLSEEETLVSNVRFQPSALSGVFLMFTWV